MKGGGDLRRTLRLFGRFTHGHRRSFLFAVLMLGLEAITAVAFPVLIGKLADFVLDGKQVKLLGVAVSSEIAIYVIAAGIVVATAVNSFSASVAEINLATAGRTLGFNLRGWLFAHLQRLPLAFHLRRSTGDVLTRLTGDVKAMEDFIEDSVADIIGSVFVLGASLYLLFDASPVIGLLALTIVPLMSLVSNFFAKRIKSASKQERASEGELASTAQEMLASISLVQVYGRGDIQERKFAQQSRSARDAVLRTSRLEAVFGFAVAVLESLAIATVILVGYRLVTSDTTGDVITGGVLITSVGLTQGMFKPVRRIIKQWNRVAAVYASVDRVNELIMLQPTVFDYPDARPAPQLRGELAFRDVSFAYQSPSDDPNGLPGRLALQGVNFRVNEGESVALVGHSGAGKSTIAQLVPRLYDPHVGGILIDGYDIRAFTLDSLRAQISMVLQETILLRGTVAENIAYGREGATPEDVVRAAQQASAHEFILNLPDGYDTVLGERAATLSGGQRQRLAIARAFIRNAPLLILDEPTTGLDTASAALVAESLKELARNRTTLIVSHDFNLIRTVDRVLVISAGQVFEEGSPEDLLASGGLYADLYAHQFGEAAVAAGAAGDGARELVAADGAGTLSELDAELEVLEREQADARRFDTVLAQAMPRPATREQFLAVTGWIPTVGIPVAGEVDLDPLHSPHLTRTLPGLTEALSSSAMGARLQRMLADDWELLSCSPGKTLVEPGTGATLQYRLDLRRRGANETAEHLVAGRLFPTVDAAEEWRSKLDPLAERLAGRRDLAAFTWPTLLVRELRLVLHAFPVDPGLPGLGPATDPDQLVDRLGPLLKSSVPGLRLEGIHADVVRYRQDACVLRYELAWHLQPSRRSLKQVVYGKLYADGRGQLVGPAVTALRQRLDQASSPLRFQVPRFQGYLPDLQLALLEAVPGSPLLRAMIKAQRGVPGMPAFPGLTPEEAVAACARIAAALHQSSIPVGPPRPLAEEIDRVRAAVDDLAPLAPALATSLHRHLGGVGDLAHDPPSRPVVAHGDFEPAQVLFDGATTGLIDFDTVCLAEPALDLGQFTARLAVALRTAADGAGPARDDDRDLESAFLDEYVRRSDDIEPDVLAARVAAHRTVALARLAVRSWCQLKPYRLRPVMTLLDQPPRIRSRVP